MWLSPAADHTTASSDNMAKDEGVAKIKDR